MRKYAPRSTLAVFRKIAGLSQKELAELVDRSARTIQAIEINKLALSKDLAQRVAQETSVSAQWLLSKDLTRKPYVYGPVALPYSKEHFARTRALIEQKKEPTFLAVVGDEAVKKDFGTEVWELLKGREEQAAETWPVDLPAQIVSILATIRAATHLGRQEIAAFRLNRFVKEFRNEFGQKVDEPFVEAAGAILFTGLDQICDFSEGFKLPERQPFFWSPLVPKDMWENVGSANAKYVVKVDVPPGVKLEEANQLFRKQGVLSRTAEKDALVLRKLIAIRDEREKKQRIALNDRVPENAD